jgi:hypothetical protein
MLTNLLDDITNYFQKPENCPPAFDEFQKQSLITAAAFEKTIWELLSNDYEIGMLVGCLLYYWINLAASISNLDKACMNRSDVTMEKAFNKIARRLIFILNKLPDVDYSNEKASIIEKMDILKKQINEDGELRKDYFIPYNAGHKVEHVKQQLYQTAAHLLLDQNIHEEIISNCILLYWVRLATLTDEIPEKYLFKMQHYFKEVVLGLHDYLPKVYNMRKTKKLKYKFAY